MCGVEEKFRRLIEWFRCCGDPVVVAFSGGVDSSVVLAVAVKALGRENVVAVTVTSPTYPEEDLSLARDVAKFLGVEHVIVETDELSDPNFVRNPPNRCYYCKQHMIKKLIEVARRYGARVIVNGTNLSDSSERRPGVLALREYGVRSPLVEVCLSKDEVREVAKLLGLPNWDKPSMACLASRIPYGSMITVERLRRIALAERIVREFTGVGQVRVRDHDYIARIEVGRYERRRFFSEELMDRVAIELMKLGYKYVTLDLLGYRSGSLDELLK